MLQGDEEDGIGGDDADTTGRDVGGREGGLQGQDATTFDVLLGGGVSGVAKTSSRKGSINPDVIANFNSPLQVRVLCIPGLNTSKTN